MFMHLEEKIVNEFDGFNSQLGKFGAMMMSSFLMIILKSGGYNFGQKRCNPPNQPNSRIIQVVKLPLISCIQ